MSKLKVLGLGTRLVCSSGTFLPFYVRLVCVLSLAGSTIADILVLSLGVSARIAYLRKTLILRLSTAT